MNDDAQSFEDYKDEVKATQAGQDYESIKQDMASHNDFMVELDNLPKQGHIWIDRGVVMSCENAGHANHQAFKLR